ncbi:aminotransferase class I/II-fold pyridoxal phosphate-dependent enzyme [Desulforamulus ruminis]|uniref:Aluminum resistance family protein n=1 Tax=Desulforamulus ruminis (strain ATCC 23193 / DSM 2154 / NCIMB 8452 / DL) TaxID=696281 RepID=F6DV90_DESRL|nr:methionine gamma-lyase family protein [Desulforamulus ruminis]AEG60243.1 aluminum resistance family protein [Desulforamulus ruminis DSM 2154]
MHLNQLDKLAIEVETEVQPVYREIEARAMDNHARVLEGFHRARVADYHLRGTTGYGYNDAGREALETVYAHIFGAEAALVRGQIVSGTHAIALALFGLLRPGDELLAVQGSPYDTLEELIGKRGNAPGSLRELGVGYRQVELTPEGTLDWQAIEQGLNEKTRVVLVQRSRGYAWRPSLTLDQLKKLITFIKTKSSRALVFVDNCYGELVDMLEPPAIGADLAAGSLIKNPGGGLAPTGGYVVGRRELVEMAANRLTAPGIGGEVGPSLGHQRLLFQGIFLAPHTVAEALKGAVFVARLFERLGFKVSPSYDEPRSDIIQSIALETPERLVAFCQGLQAASPVDAHALPEPDYMPGYEDDVIMAAGTFVQGASIELSADAPLRKPYAVYLQGGLSKEYVRLGVLSAARKVLQVKG